MAVREAWLVPFVRLVPGDCGYALILAKQGTRVNMSLEKYQSKLFQGPGGDGGVDLGHEADGFLKGRDDLPIVQLVVITQGPFPPILQPLFTNLIAANMEIPDFGRDAFKVL